MIRNIPKYNGAGVYAIINKEEKKVYIGISNNIRNRILKHNSDLKKGIHINKKLNNDRRKKLNVVILEKIPELNERNNLLEYVYMSWFYEMKFEMYNEQPKNCLNGKISFSQHIATSLKFTAKINGRSIRNLFK